MNFTFGIVTTGHNVLLDEVITSIYKAMVMSGSHNQYEILVVGGDGNHTATHIPFNDTLREGWITRKKNIITTSAKYENIVYLHDYFALSPNWYKAFENLKDYKVAMTPIKYRDGRRFRDWCLDAMIDGIGREKMLPYDITNMSKLMYISGGYWIAKRDVMMEISLDERRLAGMEEDVDWSHRVREKYDFTLAYQPDSYAIVLKDDKPCVFTEMGDGVRNIVKDLTNEQIRDIDEYTKNKLAATWRKHCLCGNGRGWRHDGRHEDL